MNGTIVVHFASILLVLLLSPSVSTLIPAYKCGYDEVLTIQKTIGNKTYVSCASPLVCGTNPGCDIDEYHECSSFAYLYAIDPSSARNTNTCCKLNIPPNYYVSEICHPLGTCSVIESAENLPKPSSTNDENNKMTSNSATDHEMNPQKQLIKSIVSTKDGPMVTVCEIVCQTRETKTVVDANPIDRTRFTEL